MKERRYIAELRKRDNDDGSMSIEGYAVVFNSPATYDGEAEIISEKAFENCDMSDVVLRYNHSDVPYTLARTRNGSLKLEIDEKGLKFTADLIPTTMNKDAYLMVQSGLLDKCSFAFGDWKYDYDKKTRTTTINEIGKLFDVSLVDFPYYQETSVEARSLDVTNNIREEIRQTLKNELLEKLKKDELLKKL